LKNAAEKLNINYSTAKTIVQTYRKENRISKRPKHAITTKKSLKREQFLSRVLAPTKLAKIMSKIEFAECKLKKKRKSLKSTKEIISEACTLAATGQAVENPIKKAFHRIESAGQIQLLETEKEGPKPGQVTRAVFADIPLNLKRDIFYVHSECKSEEELKKLISYEDKKRKGEVMKTREIQKKAVEMDDKIEKKEPGLFFDFSKYRTMILSSAYARYE